MRTFLIVALALAGVACAREVKQESLENTAYGYLTKYGVPEAERIRKAEEQGVASRIIGGLPAALGQYPYQAGLLIDIIGFETGRGVCGGSVVSVNRILTAAHCWFDGMNQAWRVEVVLGSITLFSGGTRQHTSAIAVHPNWFPQLVRNDVAVIYLPTPVTISSTISPVSLPSGSDLNNDFVNESAIASGFGLTANGAGISQNQFLSHVRLNVISNSVCSFAFPLILQDSNICTSGIGGPGTCNGDSGGPLVVERYGSPVQIGVVSFGSTIGGCEGSLPAAYARVTSFIDFFTQHI